MAAVEIDRHLKRRGDECWIVFPATETKTHRDIEMPLPTAVADFLELYLRDFRPLLLRKAPTQRLWLSAWANPMTDQAVYIQITRLTHDVFGKAIKPHDLRAMAATTIAVATPENIDDATALLTHAGRSMTQRYYIRAQSTSAGRRHAGQVVGLRRRLPAPSEWRLKPKRRRRPKPRPGRRARKPL
jgi:integrase